MSNKSSKEERHAKGLKQAKEQKQPRMVRSVPGRMIIERIEKKPGYPREIAQELGLNEKTVGYNLRTFLPSLGLIKQLEDGRYTVRWYDPEGEKVRDAYAIAKRQLLRTPKPEEIAHIIKELPGIARDLLYKYIPGYYEPTAQEIEESTQKVWDLMCWGAREDFPKVNDIEKLVKNGLEEVRLKHIPFHDAIDILANTKPGRAYLDDVLDEITSYLKECPEMKPKVIHRVEGDILLIELNWADEALIHVNRFPMYNTDFLFPGQGVLNYVAMPREIRREDEYFTEC